MSRPTSEEQAELEALEGVAAVLNDALRACGVLSIRFRQIWRRSPGLGREIEWAGEEIARIVDDCDRAMVLIRETLQANQTHRCRANEGLSSDRTGGKNGHSSTA